MSQDWEIRASSKVCQVTGQPFTDQQPIYSKLVYTEQGYQRQDFSENAWKELPKDDAVSFWKTVYNAPPPPAPEAVKKETAETMLRQFMEKEDYSRKNAIYILAVMLERKRILLERDVQVKPDGTKVRIYEHKKTGEIFTIPDPGLRLDELENVTIEVQEMLGIPPRGGAVPAAPAPAQPDSSEPVAPAG